MTTGYVVIAGNMDEDKVDDVTVFKMVYPSIESAFADIIKDVQEQLEKDDNPFDHVDEHRTRDGELYRVVFSEDYVYLIHTVEY